MKNKAETLHGYLFHERDTVFIPPDHTYEVVDSMDNKMPYILTANGRKIPVKDIAGVYNPDRETYTNLRPASNQGTIVVTYD